MAIYARIQDSLVIEMHTVSDEVPDADAFLAELWGGNAGNYIITPLPDDNGFPRIGYTWDGTNFAAPEPPEVAP